MHLRPVKYTATEKGVELAGLRSTRLPTTPLDGGNHNKSNPLFTARQCPPLQRSSANVVANVEQVNLRSNNINGNNNYNMIEASGRVSALKSLPIKHFNIANCNNKPSDRPLSSSFLTAIGAADTEIDLHDKMKLMELSIINLVDSSCLVAEENNLELALIKSKEALDKLASMRAIVLQKHGSIEPATTGVRFVELALMVNCNLATQLKNSGHLERSLELYTQITKLAGSFASDNQSNSLLISGQQLNGDSKFLLYRFGMNIGNVLYCMKDYHRALKHYRLTLDRLSTLPMQVSLRIKLMNNISLALLALKQENEAISSMKLLLSENLSYYQQQQQQLISENHSKKGRSNEGELDNGFCNGNHHRFGLNLIVCHYRRHDSASIMATLKGLIKADISRQYERVFVNLDRRRRQTPAPNQGRANEQFRSDGGLKKSDAGRESGLLNKTNEMRDSASFAQADHTRPRLSGSRTTSSDNDDQIKPLPFVHSSTSRKSFGASPNSADGKRDVTYGQSLNLADTQADGSLIDSGDGGGRRSGGGSFLTIQSSSGAATGGQEEHGSAFVFSSTKPSDDDKLRYVMTSIQEDRLEMLIGEKDKQIARSIMLGCNLLLDLDNNSVIDHEANRKQPTQANQTNNGRRTSAYEFCLDLLMTSSIYKNLVQDLKTDQMSGMLSMRYKLDEAVALFKEIGAHDWPDEDRVGHQWQPSSVGGEPQQAVSTHPIQQADRLSNNHLLNSGEIKYTAEAISEHQNEQQQQRPMLKSSAMAINKGLVYLLQKRYDMALQAAEESSILNADLVESLVNHANCLVYLDKLTEADSYYQQAIRIEPNCWEAHYNLVILCRKLNRKYTHLSSSTKSRLADDRQILTGSSLLDRKMILSTIQSALIFMQSGNEKQAITIFNDLVTNSRQAPEVHLLISKLISEESTVPENGYSQAQVVLQQAHRENPYHLPVLERLIALKIRGFEYDSAKQLLLGCIKNRPNQVKWYQMLAECHRRAAEYNMAIAIYKTAITTFPQDTSCLKALIKLTDELGMIEDKRIYEKKLDRRKIKATCR